MYENVWSFDTHLAMPKFFSIFPETLHLKNTRKKIENFHENLIEMDNLHHHNPNSNSNNLSYHWTFLYIFLNQFQTVTHLKLFFHVVCAIVVGLLFGDSGINATKTISNIASFLVHILYLWYTTLMPGVLKCKVLLIFSEIVNWLHLFAIVPSEMKILRKESFNNWYKIRTYFVAAMLTTLPVQVKTFLELKSLNKNNRQFPTS